MLTLIFCVMLISIFGRLIYFSLTASWTILKVLLSLVFLPIALIIIAALGLFEIAIPVLAISGLISLFDKKRIGANSYNA